MHAWRRLREALIIRKSGFPGTEPEVSFKGTFYEIDNAYLEPKPLQKPHIPIWVPGDLEATRQLAAELADCWLIYSKPPDRCYMHVVLGTCTLAAVGAYR